MKAFIVLAAIVASASAGVLLASPYGISPLGISQLSVSPLARTIAVAAPQTLIAPAVTSSQYHAQDELGQYSYGYAGGPSAKSEIKTADGITRGGYSYIDANGVVQTVNYVSDALGFRVAATNLPVAPVAPAVAPVAALPGPIPQQVQDTPEVAAAKAKHLEAVAAAAAAAAAAPEN